MASVQKFACSDAAVKKMCPHANEKIFYNNVNSEIIAATNIMIMLEQ